MSGPVLHLPTNDLAYMRPFYMLRCHPVCYRLHSTPLALSTSVVVQQLHPPSSSYDLSITLLNFNPWVAHLS